MKYIKVISKNTNDKQTMCGIFDNITDLSIAINTGCEFDLYMYANNHLPYYLNYQMNDFTNILNMIEFENKPNNIDNHIFLYGTVMDISQLNSMLQFNVSKILRSSDKHDNVQEVIDYYEYTSQLTKAARYNTL